MGKSRYVYVRVSFLIICIYTSIYNIHIFIYKIYLCIYIYIYFISQHCWAEVQSALNIAVEPQISAVLGLPLDFSLASHWSSRNSEDLYVDIHIYIYIHLLYYIIHIYIYYSLVILSAIL